MFWIIILLILAALIGWTFSKFNTTFTIKKGNHYANLFLRLFILNKPKILNFEVTFDKSWFYDLNSVLQLDVNKVVGVGFLPNHQVDSVRFGARFNLTSNRIEIIPYAYNNGVRDIGKDINGNTIILASCLFNQPYNFILSVNSTTYTLRVDKDNISQGPVAVIKKRHTKKLAYLLKPYFGGLTAAPHNIKTKIHLL